MLQQLFYSETVAGSNLQHSVDKRFGTLTHQRIYEICLRIDSSRCTLRIIRLKRIPTIQHQIGRNSHAPHIYFRRIA